MIRDSYKPAPNATPRLMTNNDSITHAMNAAMFPPLYHSTRSIYLLMAAPYRACMRSAHPATCLQAATRLFRDGVFSRRNVPHADHESTSQWSFQNPDLVFRG